ncbi:MAG TPA: glycosyltransferase family 2 protein [Haliangiales bacterium]|nr:glycosyltransferase family 2 protein [Haliangiales bacterium]
MRLDVVIPAHNDEATVADVVRAVTARTVRSVVVVDSGSTDTTARRAEDAGAVVVRAGRGGEGAACQRGIAHLGALPKPPEAVVFLAGDGSDDPADLAAVVRPLEESLFDLSIGSRVLGRAQLTAAERAGNFLAVHLISAIYGHKYTDVPTFRAIRYPALVALHMREAGPGFWVEMQVKALKLGLRVAEVPVAHRPSKARGLRGRAHVGARVLYQILRHSTAR